MKKGPFVKIACSFLLLLPVCSCASSQDDMEKAYWQGYSRAYEIVNQQQQQTKNRYEVQPPQASQDYDTAYKQYGKSYQYNMSDLEQYQREYSNNFFYPAIPSNNPSDYYYEGQKYKNDSRDGSSR